MKKAIHIILLFCLVIFHCKAQTHFSSEQLDGTTWIPVIQPPVCIDTITYTKSKVITKSDFSESYEKTKSHLPDCKKTIINSKDYYLSDTVPDTFDFSKFNKTSVGEYIIRYNDIMKTMSFNRIIKLDIADGILILERYNSLVGFEPVEYRMIKRK